MSETIPKCTHWLGHKFEGRYSSPPVAEEIAGMSIRASEYATAAKMLMDAARGKDYERDICVRCGHAIERQITNEKAEAQV
jgi:hypothetical protein